jgi:LCP family protein required for cell wall assembly
MSRGLIAIVVIGFLLAGLGGTGASCLPLLTSTIQDTGHTAPTPTPHATAGAAGGGTATASGSFTVLLMGSDNDGKQGNNQTPLTQTMILVRVDSQTNQVTMLSLPRDLYLPLYDSNGDYAGTNKLDVSFTGGTFPTGAAQAAINTVQTDFHIQVDDWAWIGLQGLVNLINYVGGVDVVVTSPVMDDLYPADVGTQNAYGYQRLAILPGPQHMNGQQALDYVRSRHASTYGDFSRSARQQQVLVALRDKLKNLSPADLPKLSAAVQGQVDTNLSPTQIAGLLPLARSVSNAGITQVTLAAPQFTTGVTLSDGDQILQPDMPAIQAEIWKYFPEAQ